jgi:hypothetical protein
MNTRQKFLRFSSSQQSSLVLLLIIVAALQYYLFYEDDTRPIAPLPEEAAWVKKGLELDSIRIQKSLPLPPRPYNPNFITDYKGYLLGMSTIEIDRLHAFRKEGRFVNSAQEFQKVTGMSDSLLKEMAVNFKFPDWVNKKGTQQKYTAYTPAEVVKQDINQATAEQLIAVYGIGPALSERVLKQREALGGFVSMEQVGHVWGVSPEVTANVAKRFHVAGSPAVKKIEINKASMKELSQFPYFRYPISKDIVTFRSMSGEINRNNLSEIPNFPIDNIDIIAVYLTF